MRNSHGNSSRLRRFIREAALEQDVITEMYVPTFTIKAFLDWLVPPVNIGDSPDPCSNFYMYMNEEENKKQGHFILGLALAGIGIAGGIQGAASLFSGAWRAAAAGRYLGALARSAGGALLGAGIVATGEQTYELAFLTLSDNKTLKENGVLSDFDRNRKIARILGNLYIGAALGPWTGSKLSGGQVINLFRNAENLSNFKNALFESYAFLSNSNAAMIVNVIIGSRFETFYNNGALSGLAKLDKETLYNIDDDFAKILANEISKDSPGENITFTSAEIYKHWLISTMQQMCDEGKPGYQIQPYYDEFIKIKRASG